MAHNYLRHRIGGAGFYEEISSDSDEYEENDELDPVEEENAAELGVNFDDDFLEDDGVPGLEEAPADAALFNEFENFPHLREDLELLANFQGLLSRVSKNRRYPQMKVLQMKVPQMKALSI